MEDKHVYYIIVIWLTLVTGYIGCSNIFPENKKSTCVICNDIECIEFRNK